MVNTSNYNTKEMKTLGVLGLDSLLIYLNKSTPGFETLSQRIKHGIEQLRKAYK